VLRRFGKEERHATWLELFFDLCFVAAVAALADGLHHDPSFAGILRFAGLFVPVWWAWMGFTWYATAFDNDDALFRVCCLAAMLAVIVLAATVGSVGTGGDTTVFVFAYAALQLVLAGLFLRVWRHATPAIRPFCARYGLGDALGAGVWLVSLGVGEPARYVVWALGMFVLMSTPVLAVRSYAGRAFDPMHIPERYGLFTLIVLGESIVAVVAGTASISIVGLPAFVGAAGFVLAACVWWIYFDFVKAAGLRRENLFSAFTWGYGHLLIFAGIAAAAVGVEFAIEAAAHDDRLGGAERAALCGGLAAFLLAISAIHAITTQRWDATLGGRLAAAVGVAMVGVVGAAFSAPLVIGVLMLVFLGLLTSEIARARFAERPTEIDTQGSAQAETAVQSLER
jgi:low temperature requirement protein LtrA